VIWTLLLGVLAATVRMIAIGYASMLLPRRERQNPGRLGSAGRR
jgi:hypothetical protein